MHRNRSALADLGGHGARAFPHPHPLRLKPKTEKNSLRIYKNQVRGFVGDCLVSTVFDHQYLVFLYSLNFVLFWTFNFPLELRFQGNCNNFHCVWPCYTYINGYVLICIFTQIPIYIICSQLQLLANLFFVSPENIPFLPRGKRMNDYRAIKFQISNVF